MSEENAFLLNGRAVCVYGDPAYPHRVHIQAPFRNADITDRIIYQRNEFFRSICGVAIGRGNQHISLHGLKKSEKWHE